MGFHPSRRLTMAIVVAAAVLGLVAPSASADGRINADSVASSSSPTSTAPAESPAGEPKVAGPADPNVPGSVGLAIINAERAKAKLPELANTNAMFTIAADWSRYMSGTDQFVHMYALRDVWYQVEFARANGFMLGGDLLGWGYADEAAVAWGWLNSPAHRAWLMDEHGAMSAAGIARSGSYWTLYVAGLPLNSPAPSYTPVPSGATVGAPTTVAPEPQRIEGALTSTPTPTISGTARPGSTLTANAGAWAPAPVTLAYQWLRDGQAISGATKSTYAIAGDDVDRQISVRVRGTKTDYASVSKTSTVVVARDSVSFLDVTRTPGSATYSPFWAEIRWMSSNGISTGYPVTGGSQYRPTATVNRDAMAAFMYRMAGSPAFTPPRTSPFRDVTPTTQFYKEITWLASRGITTGWDVPGGKEYRPTQPVNRDAMSAFLYRYSGSPSFTPPRTSPFRDVPANAQFYKEIAWLASRGISTGWDVTGGKEYRSLQPVNRDAMAAFMYRLKNG